MKLSALDEPIRNALLEKIQYFIGPLFLKNEQQGAATGVYVATHPSLGSISGKYFADCNIAIPRTDPEDPLLADQLWSVSEEILKKIK